MDLDTCCEPDECNAGVFADRACVGAWDTTAEDCAECGTRTYTVTTTPTGAATCDAEDEATESCACTSAPTPTGGVSGASSAAPAFLVTAAAALFWA